MNVELIAEAQRWNDFVAVSGKGHLLQSFEWARFKAKFGWEAERVALTDRGNIVAGAQLFFRRSPIGPMAYVPRGPITREDDPDGFRQLMEALHDLARERKSIFLKVEPNETSVSHLTSLGFHPSHDSIQPRTTIHIDLRPNMEVIASRQKPKTRYNVRLAAKRGVVVREGGVEHLPAFYDLLKVTGKRDGFLIHAYDYYKEAMSTLGDHVKLFSAFFEEELLASIMVMSCADEAIYMYGASGDSRRNLMPTYLLQWEAMKWAKSAGCSRYDLWGIPDEAGKAGQDDLPEDEADEKLQVERKDGLWGVYRFKRGFGGSVVRYAGAYDYAYTIMRYWAWQKAVPLYARLLSRAVA